MDKRMGRLMPAAGAPQVSRDAFASLCYNSEVACACQSGRTPLPPTIADVAQLVEQLIRNQ